MTALETVSPSSHERAFYGQDARVVAPSSHEEVLDLVREAEAKGTPLVPAGTGAHAYLGNPPPEGATVVSLRRFDRVLRYEPGDFTVGVQAGLHLRTLRETLEKNGQEVPVDFALDPRGTVGGLVAAAQPCARRGRHGPVRALVIGMHAVRCGPAGPSIYKTGSMVVKNVAGYEVMKLLAGSLGTAGPILEVNFKLRPLPERRSSRLAAFATREKAWELAGALRARNLEPAALWVLEGEAARELARRCPGTGGSAGGNTGGNTAGIGGSVVWIFEGSSPRVAWQETQAEAVLSRCQPEATRFLSGADLDALFELLCDFASPGPEPRDDLGVARLSALPTRAPELAARAMEAASGHEGALAGTASDVLSGLVTVRWTRSTGTVDLAAPVADLSVAIKTLEGTGVLVYLPPSLRRAHPYLLTPDPSAAVSRRILKAFDPGGIFSPGRILGAG